jgi:hypothetical protein
MYAPKNQLNQRGVLLTLWLTLMLAANIMTGFMYFLLTYAELTFSPTNVSLAAEITAVLFNTIPLWAAVLVSIFDIVNVVGVIALFKWRKLGFYALFMTTVAALVVNVWLGVGIYSILGLSGIIILYFLLRQKWALLH